MELIRSIANQVRLVRYDEIPLVRLGQRATLAKLGKLFQFSEVNASASDEGQGTVVAIAGVFADEEGEHALAKLVIEERRLLLNIEGHSDVAERIFQRLRIFLAELANRHDDEFLQPVVLADETELVVRLSFSADQLIAPGFLAFVNTEIVRATTTAHAATTVDIAPLEFEINYHIVDPSLAQYRISLSRKEFTFGPRPGAPRSERVYVSKAPVDTATHIGLIKNLEARLATFE